MKRHVLMPLIALAVAANACSLEDTTAPPLAGPSEFALGIAVAAVPDHILQDGISQSFVTITAKGPDGRPARGVGLRLSIVADGVEADFGRLSTKLTTTGDDGQARVTYTAPPKPAESVGAGRIVTILVTPIGSDFRGEHARQVDIRVIPPGVILPPNTLVPEFTVTPESPTAFTPVTFDASRTAVDQAACGDRCTYRWTFGDGGSGAGMIVQHEFRSVGPFAVQLSATDPNGRTRSITKTIAVGAGAAPTARFTFSPSAPLPGQAVFFNASASTAAAGRRVVRYAWDFGTGRTGEGVTVSKTFDAAGTYTVLLEVTDDANQVGTVTQTVAVGGGAAVLPTASFVFSPENPLPGQTIFFNATASTAGPGRTLASYRWDFGSGREGTGVTISKGYDTAGAYVVTLTVTDDRGQQGVVSRTVTVGSSPPTATFVFSPTAPRLGDTVFFNASASRASAGRQIVSYRWDFGDGSPNATGVTASRTYANEGTYIVVLSVTDDAGLVTTVSQPVPVKLP